MAKKNAGTVLYEMANRLYEKRQELPGRLYRLFRVYHPVYELPLEISVAHADESYHIIERYMDRLICGPSGADKRIYIRDRQELYALLGLDADAWKVAEVFFEDLKRDGHFAETVQGILPEGPAYESVKQQKRVTNTTASLKKLVDAYDGSLMPVEFYDLKAFAWTPEEADDEDDELKEAVWLPMGYITEPDVMARRVSGRDYTGEHEKYRLPTGAAGQTVAADCEELEELLQYIPYLLAVYRLPGGRMRYVAYRPDSGEEIPGFGDKFAAAGYAAAAAELLQGLSQVRETKNDVRNPLCTALRLRESGGGIPAGSGVTPDGDENYSWQLQDSQLPVILGLQQGERFYRTGAYRIANGAVSCCGTKQAGRLVYVHKTEAQKQLLLEAVKEPEKREEAYRAYMREVYPGWGEEDNDADQSEQPSL